MTYWTMNKDDMYPAVTLCEEEALAATNVAAQMMGLGPYDDMQTAATELEAVLSIFGAPGATFGFSSSEEGECDACKERGAA